MGMICERHDAEAAGKTLAHAKIAVGGTMRKGRAALARALALALAGLILPATVSAQAGPGRDGSPGERVVDLPLGAGLAQRVLYAAPRRPLASLVMLPGGAGDVGLAPDGDVRHDDNFVVRTRTRWVARGYAVVIPDTLERASLRGVRSSPAYAALVEGLVAFAHHQARAPVFLLGTSQGAIAAMNGAARARPGALAGVVLSESVSRMGASGETVFDADPQGVRVPALVVADRDDACRVAPPQDAPRIVAAMTHSAGARLLTVAGGIERSANPCGSLSAHGYYGIEDAVIDGIDRWLRTHL